ncbi:hypothetical protein D9757_012067 [Collybiopsis confluens]|uniref:DUF6534 domain-containing protein n=1 Tax=Collybiopsis confluens TaxID=2823264 RepID=A0A8H5LLJ3_9AGAR|nr:hypothetical protein D9757_012067 [Collybiopsis confluens]
MPLTNSDAVTSYSSLLVGGLIAFRNGVGAVCGVLQTLPPGIELVQGHGSWGLVRIHNACLPWKGLIYIETFNRLLDLIHSAFIGASLYLYFINWFGEEWRIDTIPWSIAFTVVITAVQTFIAHCYFANKIYRSSKKSWYFAGPVIFLAMLRLIAAGTSTGEMIADKEYSVFNRAYPGWIFTLGLSLSSAVDVLIAADLIYLLRKLKLQMGSTSKMIKVVDTLTLYTLENGFLTGYGFYETSPYSLLTMVYRDSVATTASLICWVAMPHNLSFLGLHFVIEKLYANSILASLNTRKELRDMRPRISPWADRSLPVLSADDFSHHPRDPLSMLLQAEYAYQTISATS